MKWLIGSDSIKIYISLALFVVGMVILTNKKRTKKQKRFLIVLSGAVTFVLLILAEKLQ